jgi:oligopeptide/dipeptide ABC transporter ATP-binding protein
MNLLSVEHLRTGFDNGTESVVVVDDVSFFVAEGETFGLVGESGCGKSVSVYSILGLLPTPPGKVLGGRADFRGQDLLSLSQDGLRSIRGADIGMIFQEPSSYFNPVFTVGEQIIEPMLVHKRVRDRTEAVEKAVGLLGRVGIPLPEKRFHCYPHELSGGMKQRAMIAMALACDPVLLVADEPTTALDVTIQAQIMDLMADLQAERKMSVLLITHNLGIVAQNADRVAVMYAGRIVEEGPTDQIIADPLHPYTRGLLRAVPDPSREEDRLYAIPGTVPSPSAMPQGCRFAPRCPFAKEICRAVQPAMVRPSADRRVACVLVEGPAS